MVQWYGWYGKHVSWIDLVPERADKTNFPHSLSGRNENTIVINHDNEMSRLVNSTKDGLFCLQNTVEGKGKGS